MRQQVFRPTGLEERAEIVWLWVEGWSVKAIAQYTGTSITTVYRWIRRWQKEGNVSDRPRSGRPRSDAQNMGNIDGVVIGGNSINPSDSWEKRNVRMQVMTTWSSIYYVMVVYVCAAIIWARQPLPQDASQGVELMQVAVSVVKASWQPGCSLIFFGQGYTSPASLIQDELGSAWGKAVFQEIKDPSNTTTHQKLSRLLIHQARQGVRQWWCVTLVVWSDNPSFLANWTYSALQAGLLVWPTQLLVLTRLPVSHLDSFQVAFSQANVLTISCPSQTSCGVWSHLPYSRHVEQVASWSPHQGLILSSHKSFFPDKFYRFSERPLLRAAAEEFPPHIVIKERQDMVEIRGWQEAAGRTREVANTKYIFSGAMTQVASFLAQSMNFTYIIERPPDGSFGTRLADGRTTGMVGMVGRKEVDFGLGPFGITAARAEVVDYTAPVVSDFLRILGGRGRPEVDPWGFLLPFGPYVWCSMLCALFLLMLSAHFLADCFIKNKPSMATYIRVLLQENTSLGELSGWERPMLGGWMTVMVVLTQSYTGTLMSLLAVRYIPQPFQTLRTLLDQPAVTMVWEYDTAYVHHFRTTETGDLKKVRDVDAAGGVEYVLATQYPNTLRDKVRLGSHVFIGEHLTSRVLMADQFSQSGPW
ncbi:hypothetical protein Pmani_018570 [Petrolisthes manimaculis]|uniref:Ionotropic glutamate receptor L-glutamate and glycine-binding domain-containing protein n=1 Tax=Petrolisthes manimaculis TaxID=1843537 RepID=A0AAE1PM67_9EUCA|nr:hypothetical protein Pmani_018570 [Petrolisthes manimaculis]